MARVFIEQIDDTKTDDWLNELMDIIIFTEY